MVLRLTQPWWSSGGLTNNQVLWLMIFGLALSVAVDVDILWTSRTVGLHHEEITHQPFFWVLVSVGLVLLGLLIGIKWLLAAGIVVFLSMMTHMFLDTFGVVTGVNWLAPFSDKPISFTGMRPVFLTYGDRIAYYLQNWQVFLRDAVVVGMGLSVFVVNVIRGTILI